MQKNMSLRLIALVLLLTGMLPAEDRALAAIRPAQAVKLITIAGQGLSFGVPTSWWQVPQSTGVAGVYQIFLAAPACESDPADPFCAREGALWPLVGVTAERAISRSSPPGDELAARLAADRTPSNAVRISGASGTRYTEPDASLWGQTVTLEHGGVYYHLRFSAGLLAIPGGADLVDSILGAVMLTPETAPEPFLPGDRGYRVMLPLVAAAPQPVLAARIHQALSAIQAAPEADRLYDAEAAAQYADQYALARTNSDGCYLTSIDIFGNGVACGGGPQDVDGAHFIDCALKAGELSGARCNRINSFMNMSQIRTLILSSNIGKQLASGTGARRGDVLVMSFNGSYCWGGVVVAVDPSSSSGVYVASHSDDYASRDPNAMRCNGGAFAQMTREFFRIDGAAPAVQFTAPAAGRLLPGSVRVSFQGQDDAPAGELRYTLEMRVNGGQATLPLERSDQTAADISLNTPCRTVELRVTAFDQIGNTSNTDVRSFVVGLWGDADGSGMIDAADLALVDRAWGAVGGDSDYAAALDINADNRIDASDSLWVRRHLGDRCRL